MSGLKMGLIFAVLLLGACGIEIREKDEAPAVRAQVREDGTWIPMSGNMFEIEEGLEPLSYRVKLQIPEGTRFFERTDRRTLQRKRYWVDTSRITDAEVTSGESYEYAFFRTPTESLASTTVHVPIDRVVNSTVAITDIDLSKPIRRLYLGPQAVIRTGAANFEMRAERLLAEPGARFETFAKGSEGGESGGQLRLFIWKGIGELRIELRGQHGRNGADGAPHPRRAQDGHSPGGNGHARHCKGMAAGGPGADGAPGNPGGHGQNGGSTGSFEIEVTDDSEFKAVAVFEPGHAGTGGAGGPGQPGGHGGAAEHRTVVTRTPRLGPDDFGPAHMDVYDCPRAANGPSGKPGAPGPQGKNGAPGAKGFFCLKVNGACRSE